MYRRDLRPYGPELWSSTSRDNDSTKAWIVFFSVGGVTGSFKDNDNPVRAVRGGL
jgi:hypothetical protein